jgi:hypothetical protein
MNALKAAHNRMLSLLEEMAEITHLINDALERQRIQLLITPEGLQKVTRWVIQRGVLGQYRQARGFLYQPGPSPPAVAAALTRLRRRRRSGPMQRMHQ